MKYTRQFFRSHPFAATRRKMDQIESQFIGPLTKLVSELEIELRKLTARYDSAFKQGSRSTNVLDYERSKLAGRLEKLKARLKRHTDRYRALQASLTSPNVPARKKGFSCIRRSAFHPEMRAAAV